MLRSAAPHLRVTEPRLRRAYALARLVLRAALAAQPCVAGWLGGRADSARCIQSTSRCIVHRAHGIAAPLRRSSISESAIATARARPWTSGSRGRCAAQQQRAACDPPPVALRPLRDADERRPAGRRPSCARQPPGTTRSAFAPTLRRCGRPSRRPPSWKCPRRFSCCPLLPFLARVVRVRLGLRVHGLGRLGFDVRVEGLRF